MNEVSQAFPKADEMEPAARIDYVQTLRRRVIADRKSVSDEELRHGIDCLRSDRAIGGGAKKEPKAIVRPSSLDDF